MRPKTKTGETANVQEQVAETYTDGWKNMMTQEIVKNKGRESGMMPLGLLSFLEGMASQVCVFFLEGHVGIGLDLGRWRPSPVPFFTELPDQEQSCPPQELWRH